MGKEFELNFKILLHGKSSDDSLTNVLRINSEEVAGSSHPAVYFRYKDGFELVVKQEIRVNCTAITCDDEIANVDAENWPLGTWIAVKIQQKAFESEHKIQVFVNGYLVGEQVNPNAKVYSNAKLWTSDPFLPSSDVSLADIHIRRESRHFFS